MTLQPSCDTSYRQPFTGYPQRELLNRPILNCRSPAVIFQKYKSCGHTCAFVPINKWVVHDDRPRVNRCFVKNSRVEFSTESLLLWGGNGALQAPPIPETMEATSFVEDHRVYEQKLLDGQVMHYFLAKARRSEW